MAYDPVTTVVVFFGGESRTLTCAYREFWLN
jgi:hypothetical protein